MTIFEEKWNKYNAYYLYWYYKCEDFVSFNALISGTNGSNRKKSVKTASQDRSQSWEAYKYGLKWGR